MVNRIKHIKLFCVICCWLVPVSASADYLRTVLNKPSIELGKPVQLTLSYFTTNNQPEKLSRINLAELQKSFHIDSSSDVLYNPAKNIQHWTLRLYPYQAGQFELAPIQFQNQTSQALSLQVTDAIDPKTEKPIKVRHSVSHNTPWLRQQITFTTHLITDAPLRQFDWSNIVMKQLSAVKLDTEQYRKDNQNGFSLGWAATPLIPGKVRVNLPSLNIIRDGIITHRFYPPPVHLSIKPLPIYLPANIPVGKLSITGINKDSYTAQDNLSEFIITLHSNGITDNHLPDFSHQFKNTKDLRFYPEQLKNNIKHTSNGTTIVSQYTIPFKTSSQGILSIPALSLSYFDPDSGTLQTVHSESIKLLSMNIWLVRIIMLILLITTILVAYRLALGIFKTINSFTKIQAARRSLNTAQTREELRDALRLLLQAKQLDGNSTPAQWLRLVAGDHPERSPLEQKLNILFYSDQELSDPIPLLTKQLDNYFTHSLPVLRWL